MSDQPYSIVSVNLDERETESYSAPKQSANTLFRFFKKPEYLFEALKRRAMIPRYYGENVDYLDIGLHQIAYPMICFCDITVHRLGDHMSLYGGYGIAFSKEWGIEKGIQPLEYINKNSILCKDFSAAFTAAMQAEEESPAVDFLLTQMLYMKPIEGTMPRDKGEIKKNFTDECEWRYVPYVSALGLPPAVTDSEIAGVGVLNATLSDNECCWLQYDYTDVKYIILQNEEDFAALCNVIDEVVDDEGIKRKLISKVILWNEAKEDF